MGHIFERAVQILVEKWYEIDQSKEETLRENVSNHRSSLYLSVKKFENILVSPRYHTRRFHLSFLSLFFCKFYMHELIELMSRFEAWALTKKSDFYIGFANYMSDVLHEQNFISFK